VWSHTWRKYWVNCTVLTGNVAGLRTVLSSRLSYRELRSSLRESHSFLSLPADTTMASSQGTKPSKMNKRDVTLTFIGAYRSLPELWEAENKHYSNRVKKAAVYDTLIGKWKVSLAKNNNSLVIVIHHSHTHKKTQYWQKKLTNLMENLCSAREHSVQFFVQFFYTVKLHGLT
jgi:hypothetical protein